MASPSPFQAPFGGVLLAQAEATTLGDCFPSMTILSSGVVFSLRALCAHIQGCVEC